MSVYLVRHVKAGSRHDWDGPDELRPTSKKGRRQAEALAGFLGREPIKRIVSSPYVRCVESVEPLAERLGLHVETAAALAEGAPVEAALELFVSVAPDNGVLCSHGDVIPELLFALAALDGLALPAEVPFPKASTWIIDGTEQPFLTARYVGPPAA